MPNTIAVTVTDIEAAGQQLKRDFSHPERIAVLQAIDSVDVQAGPGCGKTTLLVAKLAILATKWHWRDRGICVLSHTNVAGEEVEKSVATHASAYRLLRYPHFIGTFQTFVHTFLAFPHLRNHGITSISSVDNNRFLRYVRSHLGSVEYGLRQRFGNDQDQINRFLLSLRLSGDPPELTWRDAGVKFSPTTQTYRALHKAKSLASINGIFGFGEMYDFASAYVHDNPTIITAFRRRFPWVFVDESQDCVQTQIDLVFDLFGADCIVQRFGDSDQAIFDSNTSAEIVDRFTHGKLRVSESLRFRKSIANFANQVSATGTKLDGNADQTQVRDDRCHSIFLFRTNCIQEVLPSFGKLLLEEFPGGLPMGLTAHAVGAVHKAPEGNQTQRTPYSVPQYWSAYIGELNRPSRFPDKFIDYVRESILLKHRCGELKPAYDQLMRGIADYLYRSNVRNDAGRHLSFREMREIVRTAIKTNFRAVVAYRMLMRDLLTEDCTEAQPLWDPITARIPITLGALYTQLSVTAGKDFLAWDNKLLQPQHEEETPHSNTFEYKEAGRSVCIKVGSIHGVKGQTHAATLVLETFTYNHDLKELIPALSGMNIDRATMGKRLSDHMKRIYVGMTRPRELLCLAICSDHLSADDRASLEQVGWRIVQVSDQS